MKTRHRNIPYYSVGATILKPNKMSDVRWKNAIFSLNKKNNRSTGTALLFNDRNRWEGPRGLILP